MDDLKMLRKLISEVKQEAELGILQEGNTRESIQENEDRERRELREYVARNVVNLLKECGE